MELMVSEQGTGPAIVILHGLFGSGRNWGAIAGQLAGSYRVLALDLRNHGASPWAPGMAYADLAQDVADTLTLHGVSRAVVIGHSMGGKVAMRLALDCPALVSRVMVVDIAPKTYPMGLLGFAKAMLAVDLAAVTRRAAVDQALRDTIPDARIRGFLLQNLISEPQGLRWRLNLPVLIEEMPVLVGWPDSAQDTPYLGPALFLRGGQSDYVPDTAIAGIQRLFPGASLETVEGAGHWLHAEQPDAFLASARGFIERDLSGHAGS